MSRIELREQSDGRWLIVRVDGAHDTQRGWVSPSGISEAIVGATVAGSRGLIDIMGESIRAAGVREVIKVAKGGSQ